MTKERDRRKRTTPPTTPTLTPKKVKAMKAKEVYDAWLVAFFGMEPEKIQQSVNNLNATLNGRQYNQMKAETEELIALGMHHLSKDKMTECQNVAIK